MSPRKREPIRQAGLTCAIQTRRPPPISSASCARVGSPRPTRLDALLESRTPMVTYLGQPGTAALAARATVALGADDIGGEVVLQFEAGDPSRPIISAVFSQRKRGRIGDAKDELTLRLYERRAPLGSISHGASTSRAAPSNTFRAVSGP
jgi:hypothetical protein